MLTIKDTIIIKPYREEIKLPTICDNCKRTLPRWYEKQPYRCFLFVAIFSIFGFVAGLVGHYIPVITDWNKFVIWLVYVSLTALNVIIMFALYVKEDITGSSGPR